MTSAKQRWKRAAAALKDKRSIYLAMVPAPCTSHRNPDMEAAVIRATSHDECTVDYKNAARVFQWARTSPSFLSPLMWAILRRATRTSSWPVALKSLLLVHGLQLLNPSAGPFGCGRLPFDLSEFRDRSASSWGFSAFVRAYFRFLNQRTTLLSADEQDECGLESVEKLQTLLDLLMQIRPYADGMAAGLILDALDCVVIEIFNVYGAIAACFVDVLGSDSKKGLKGISIVRKAAEQSVELSNYFEMCRSLGVLNATELPLVEAISPEDIMDLERTANEDVAASVQYLEEEEEELGRPETVVTKDWVVFDDEFTEAKHATP